MISWMQKHNKYLVWTIWVATITFIGAGFVGWGSYNFGSKARTVAKVGDTEISKAKLNMLYADLYNRYREAFKGNFDDKKAEELGLLQQAFDAALTQAELLNYAKEIGLVVSDEELAAALERIPAFQKNGTFDKKLYETYLKNRGLTAKTFENALRDDLTVNKLLNLLAIAPLPFEKETIAAALNIEETIKYRIITPDDINVSADDEALEAYWKKHEKNYMSPERFRLEIVWTDTSDINVTKPEIEAFYRDNSFNYIDENGVQLDMAKAEPLVIRDLKLKKGKKSAQLDYIAFKKGKKEASETITLDKNDPMLSSELWEAVSSSRPGTLLKPKAVGSRYATVRIVETIAPQPLTFDKAKSAVYSDYVKEKSRTLLDELSQKTLKTIDETEVSTSKPLTIRTSEPIDGLNLQEMTLFLQKLFTSDKEKGIITVSDKRVVYAIVEQKFGTEESNLTDTVEKTAKRIKNDVFQNDFIRTLNTRYPVEIYVKGLTP
jgi:peptidyl-prolyl cis-trans isomerase D